MARWRGCEIEASGIIWECDPFSCHLNYFPNCFTPNLPWDSSRDFYLLMGFMTPILKVLHFESTFTSTVSSLEFRIPNLGWKPLLLSFFWWRNQAEKLNVFLGLIQPTSDTVEGKPGPSNSKPHILLTQNVTNHSRLWCWNLSVSFMPPFTLRFLPDERSGLFCSSQLQALCFVLSLKGHRALLGYFE